MEDIVKRVFNIYIYQNKIDGKVYIGQTYKTLKQRYNNGWGYKECPRFNNALKKHGINNFDRWIINVVSTKDEACQEEIFWIAEMRRQLGRNMVYNLTNGGDSSAGYKHTEESKKRMSEGCKAALAKKPIHNKGKPMSEDQKKKLSKARQGIEPWNKGKKGLQVGHMKGKKHTQESKQKMSSAKKNTGFVPWNKGKKGLQKGHSGSFKKGQPALNKKIFTPEQTIAIISDTRSYVKIGKDYGVSKIVIRRIKNEANKPNPKTNGCEGKTWKKINGKRIWSSKKDAK
jgi:group I intron endonuclease